MAPVIFCRSVDSFMRHMLHGIGVVSIHLTDVNADDAVLFIDDTDKWDSALRNTVASANTAGSNWFNTNCLVTTYTGNLSVGE